VSSGIDAHAMTLDGFIKHVFPDSAVRPMVENEILQIVLSRSSSVSPAPRWGRAPDWCWKRPRVCRTYPHRHGVRDEAGPLAVFCAMTATIATNGLHPVNYAKFMASSISAWLPLGDIDRRGLRDLGPKVTHLISLVREPFLIAFSTASSEAAIPRCWSNWRNFRSRGRYRALCYRLAIRSTSTAP